MTAAGGPNPLQTVLSKLPDHKRSGAGYRARCPAHDDRQASLAVGVGDDGRVLIHCHACCEPQAVLRAIGLATADLFPGRGHQANGGGAARRLAATYPYHDAGGELLYQVVRYEPKDFRQRRLDGAGGWRWSMDGVERVLGLPDGLSVILPVAGTDPGREGAIAVVQNGLCVAIHDLPHAPYRPNRRQNAA